MFLVKSQFLHQGWSNSVLLEVVFIVIPLESLYCTPANYRQGMALTNTIQHNLQTCPTIKEKVCKQNLRAGKPSGESEGKEEVTSSIGKPPQALRQPWQPVAVKAAGSTRSKNIAPKVLFIPKRSIYPPRSGGGAHLVSAR